MAWRDSGNTPVNSTGGTSGDGLVVNPSTSDLVAEIDSTQLARILVGGQSYMVNWIIGCSTNATWQLEQATSTSLAAAAVSDRTYVQTPSGQSGQYQLTYKLEKGDRLRCRLNAAVTGFATAKISAEPLT